MKSQKIYFWRELFSVLRKWVDINPAQEFRYSHFFLKRTFCLVHFIRLLWPTVPYCTNFSTLGEWMWKRISRWSKDDWWIVYRIWNYGINPPILCPCWVPRSDLLFNFFAARCFVRDNRLVGICQRDNSTHHEHIAKESTSIRSDILSFYQAVFRIRIRIHRIHMFLGLPDPDPLVRDMDPDSDPDPDPSIIMQK